MSSSPASSSLSTPSKPFTHARTKRKGKKKKEAAMSQARLKSLFAQLVAVTSSQRKELDWGMALSIIDALNSAPQLFVATPFFFRGTHSHLNSHHSLPQGDAVHGRVEERRYVKGGSHIELER
jgi:hypothetical protein